MKKAILLMLCALLLAALLITAACGGGEKSTSTGSGSTSTTAAAGNTSTSTTKTTSSVTQSQAAGGSGWGDMPVYQGAKQIQKANWSAPQSGDQDYSRVEWRYYEVSAEASAVAKFYKEKMPANGWTETAWMDTQGNSWGWYNKNNENDAAMVYVNVDEGKTIIAMWRASGKGSGTASDLPLSTKTTSSAPTSKTTTSASGGSGPDWSDMPVYKGASKLQNGMQMSVPEDGQDYTHFEWRYYEVNSAASDVMEFYNQKMPDLGWEEAGRVESELNSMVWYNKNNENDAAMVFVLSQDNKTMITLWRANR